MQSDDGKDVAYFDADFDWEEHRANVERERVDVLADDWPPAASYSSHDAVAAAGAEPSAAWQSFHARHAAGDFFKGRRYLLAEFPLLRAPRLRVLEVGCGSGSAALPLLAANSTAAVVCVDFAPAAVRAATAAANAAGLGPRRFAAVVCDCAEPPASRLQQLIADAVATGWGAGEADALPPALDDAVVDAALLIFVLSAQTPERAAALVAHVAACVRPGGALLVRDYGLLDHTQLRFPPAQRVGPRLYVRQDGTLARFFHVDELAPLAAGAGLVQEPGAARWACVDTANRGSGARMRRVFVHAVWRKPPLPHDACAGAADGNG